jgi:tetratricopeptide (TPR) repeat protein
MKSEVHLSRAATLAIPFLLALVVHARSLGNGFMSDDGRLILDNPQVTAAGPLRALLMTDWFDAGDGGRIGYWRPVVKLSLRATYRLAGASPFAFHLGNVLAHALASLLLAAVALELIGPAPALVAGALFAVHPVTVQAVSIVTARSDVLAALFTFAAFVAVLRFGKTGSGGALAGVLALELLAFGSKESALLLPVLVGLLGLAAGFSRRALARVVGASALVTAAFLLFRIFVIGVRPGPNNLASLAVAARALYVLKALGAYAVQLAVAFPTVRLPQRPTGPGDPLVLVGLLAIAAAAATAIRGRLRTVPAFAVALTGLTLAPALAVWLVHIPRWREEVPVAERWLYLPVAGIALLVGAAAGRMRTPTPAFRALLVALVAALAGASWSREGMYRSQEALGEAAAVELLRADPVSLNLRERYYAHMLRAARAVSEGRIADGLADLLLADEIAPALPDHLPVVAQAEMELGHPERAVAALERLLSPEFATRPDLEVQRAAFGNNKLSRMDRAPLWHQLAFALAAAGRPEDATAAFRRSADLARPGRPRAAHLVDLARHLVNTGHPDEARAALEKAAVEAPDWDRPRLDLSRLDESEARPGFR